MPQNKQHIKWGIIGLGNIAESFASDLICMADTSLYAVASRSESNAKHFAQKYGAQKWYNNYDALINDENVDAIYIAIPHNFHCEYTIKCLEHKKAVLCEKPLALNSAQVHKMIATAQKNDVLLMEALWTCFLPHYQYALELVKTKKYGELIKVEADFGFKTEYDPSSRLYDKNLGGGSLLDIGIYTVLVALSTLGEPDSIEANAVFSKTGIDTSCNIKFGYRNDKQALLKCTITEDTPTTATLYCEKGIIRLNKNFFGPTSLTLIQNGRKEESDFNYSSKGYSYEIRHFNDLLQYGYKESPVMTYEFSRLIIETLDKIKDLIGLSY